MEIAGKLLDHLLTLFEKNIGAAVAFVFAILCMGMMWLFIWLLKKYWTDIKLGLDKKVDELSTEAVSMKSSLLTHGTKLEAHSRLMNEAQADLRLKIKDLKEQTEYVRELSRETIKSTMIAVKKWESKIKQVEEALENYKETYGRVVHLEERTAKVVDVLKGHNETVGEVKKLLIEIKSGRGIQKRP